MGKMLYSEPEYDGEFQVVEISSQLPDYMLCFHLNTILRVKLKKKDDLKIHLEGRKKSDIYSIYIYIQNSDTTFYYLRKTVQPGSLAPLSYLMITKPLRADIFREIIENVAKINDVFDVREVPLIYENGTPSMIKTRQEVINILTDLEISLIEPKKPTKKFRG